MSKSLIIVESPAKIKTLKKFFKGNYEFASSVGHIRDLPAKEFGIDIEHDFQPQYINLPDKTEVIKKLKKAAKDADVVYLAPDPDREGESIAWHIAEILPKKSNLKRIAFHSITKQAVLDALNNPREIDISLVNAQQARRLLDRMVGYKISPILTKKIRKGKNGISAGRVQSVALKLVVEREKEIKAFIPQEYWTLKSLMLDQKHQHEFSAFLWKVDGKKVEKEKTDKDAFIIDNEKTALEIKERLEKSTYKIDKVEKKEKKRHPVPPFITSTLQQEASRHYNFPVARTMSIAQTLYEGIDMGDEGTEGLITYMRTDSVQVAPVAIEEARNHIQRKYGAQYLPQTPRKYSSKKSAQEAHEAIRPTSVYHEPDAIKKYLTSDQYKLYLLIYRRFIASQMASAVYDTVSADIHSSNNLVLKTTGSIIKFNGFLAAYEEKMDSTESSTETEENILPNFHEGDTVIAKETTATQSFTKPPARFTEASLVKELEKSGIGRPSTYASIMNKIQSREYTVKEKMTLKPTELGKIIIQMLETNFAPIMNTGFTSAMEDDLELIAEDKIPWKKLLKEFWSEFEPMVQKAEKEAYVPKIETDLPCPKCGKKLQKVWSKNKYFYGCTNYPDCDYTAPIEEFEFNKEDYDENFDWEQKCPRCGADMLVKHGRFGSFLGCTNYPKCNGIINIPKKGEDTLKPEDRPPCPAIGCDGTILLRRTRFGKIFYSCSNFPECDVIANTLEELDQKYQNYHKKAYVKKAGSGKKGGFKAKHKLSKEMQAIVNEKELSRGDVLKKIWVYIKENNCQSPKNKRIIVPDEKLAKIFDSNEPIDMMQLSKHISKHFED